MLTWAGVNAASWDTTVARSPRTTTWYRTSPSGVPETATSTIKSGSPLSSPTAGSSSNHSCDKKRATSQIYQLMRTPGSLT